MDLEQGPVMTTTMDLTAMELIDTSPPHQYLYLEEISWECYEMLVEAANERHLQITYDQGRMEITSPLPKHEKVKHLIGTMVTLCCASSGTGFARGCNANR